MVQRKVLKKLTYTNLKSDNGFQWEFAHPLW